MVWCAALYCKSDSRIAKHLRFYSFPTDKERRKKWEFICQRNNWRASKFAKLCERHFDESQYEKNRKDGWKKLKPNAIPSITNVSVCLERLPFFPELHRLKREVAPLGDGEAKDCVRSDQESVESNVLRSARSFKLERGKKVSLLKRQVQRHSGVKRRWTNAHRNSPNPSESQLTKQADDGNLEEQYSDKAGDGFEFQKEDLTMANRLASLKSEDVGNRKFSFYASRSSTPSSDMERRMDDEEESLMKEWEHTVRRRHDDSLSVRPLSVSSGESVKTATTNNMRIGSSRTASLAETSSGSLSFDFPEVDVTRRRDTCHGDVDDESRRFAYFDCPDTGQRCAKMDLNVEGFEPKDITVKSLDGRLVIHGISQETLDGVRHANEFCRKIKLPDAVAAESVRCTFSDHVLTIEAPLKSQRASREANDTPLNRPVVLSDENGRYLSLTVEIGRIFKPCDVVVKVKGQRTISVTAETVENTEFSRMNARLDREFDLLEKIDRKSLKAGCTEDLLLKIVARIKDDSPDSTKHNLGNCIL